MKKFCCFQFRGKSLKVYVRFFPAKFKERKEKTKKTKWNEKGFMNLNDKIFGNNLLQETMRAGPEMKCLKL